MYIHAGPMDGLHDGCAGEPSATRFRSSFVQNLILHHGDSRKSASSADILKFQLRSGICMNTSDEQKSPHKRALLTAKLICILFYVVIFLVFFCPFAKKSSSKYCWPTVLIALLLFFFDFPACVRSRKRSYAFRLAAEDAFLPPGLAAVWPTAERRKELAPGSLVEAGSRTSFIRLRSYQPEMFRRKKTKRSEIRAREP